MAVPPVRFVALINTTNAAGHIRHLEPDQSAGVGFEPEPTQNDGPAAGVSRRRQATDFAARASAENDGPAGLRLQREVLAGGPSPSGSWSPTSRRLSAPGGSSMAETTRILLRPARLQRCCTTALEG